VMRKLLLPATLLAAAVMVLAMAWMGDDAFITLRVIDNFVHGYGLRYNVIERVQVYTHPLWMLLLTPFYALTREAMVTTMLVSAALSMGAMWILGARIARDIRYGCLLVLAAAASRALSTYATSGLETPLTFLLLALLVWQLPRAQKAWIPAGLIGLQLLNRLDLAVLLGPVAAYLFFRSAGAGRIKVALAAALPALIWMAFSLLYYGAPFPNTAYAKLGTGFGAGELILRGLDYAKDFALFDPLLVLILCAATALAVRSRDWNSRSLGAGIVLYVAYTIVIGGDFMSGRFFAAPGFLALCLIAAAPAPRWISEWSGKIWLGGMAAILVLLVVRMTEAPINVTMISGPGISDERRFYYPDTGLLPVLRKWMATGHEPVPPWGQRGLQLNALGAGTGNPVVISATAIGMRGYYGGPIVHVVDEVALADAFLARLPAIPGARVGHYQRRLPAGYVETITSAAPTTATAALRPLLDDIVLATRAPLFAQGRWGAIWRLLSGRYAWIYSSGDYAAEP
jgi:arabinofuranosyltransferase